MCQTVLLGQCCFGGVPVPPPLVPSRGAGAEMIRPLDVIGFAERWLTSHTGVGCEHRTHGIGKRSLMQQTHSAHKAAVSCW